MMFLEKVAQTIVLFDGAMGTMLMDAGLKAGECPELWNIDHNDVVTEVHRRYYEAGSDCVETNSFGGSSLKLKSFGLENRAYELNKRAAELARNAAPEGKFVAGSVGPTGLFLRPLGDLGEEELFQSFYEQMHALKDGGVDVICIETMMDIQEATIAVKAAKEVGGLPVIATMTFNKTPQGFFTMMGVTPEDGARQLVEAGADIAGSNCGNGPDEMVDLVPFFQNVVQVPLLFQSNAGLPELKDGKTVYSMNPPEYQKFVAAFIEKGAQLIGGCCGTTPEHINLVRQLIDSLNEPSL